MLVLLTDGANTAGEVEPLKAAELAAERGMVIYTIGIGADALTVRSLFGLRQINPSADLDEETLRAVAESTGGRYFRARDTDELAGIYALLDELEPAESDEQGYRPVTELFFWPLGAAGTDPRCGGPRARARRRAGLAANAAGSRRAWLSFTFCARSGCCCCRSSHSSPGGSCPDEPAGGGWQPVVDPALRPHVLAAPGTLGQQRLPTLLGIVRCSDSDAGTRRSRLGPFAGAGLSNRRGAGRRDGSVAVDGCRGRRAESPRARKAQIADVARAAWVTARRRLVVFSAHAFTVTPLTTDNATVAALVGSLQTDIMPSQGSFPEAGLTRAASLLEQAGMTAGTILLVTDSEVSPQSLDAARNLRRDGYETSVLAVGTEEGAPIPRYEGGFLTDDRGQVVVPQLNLDGLRRLATTGGGRFARLTPDDRDLDLLFARSDVGTLRSDDENETYEADVWRDRGVWLTLLLLPVLALGFRRGWVYAFAGLVLLPGPEAQAFGWRDLWQRPDQQGVAAFEAEDPQRAATLFEDPEWGAAASYRAGDFQSSARRLEGIQTPDGHYNRGNALAKSGDLAGAIDAYDRALEIAPEHADAEYNRDLVRELLEQQQQEQQQDQTEQNDDSGQQQAQASEDQGQQSDETQSNGSEQTEDQSSDSGEQRQADNEPGDSDSDPQNPDQSENDAEPEADPGDQQQELQASALPEDIEEWASEQAADQWLRRIPQDPGGLLRRKFLYQYQRLGVDQEGNYVWPGDEVSPW